MRPLISIKLLLCIVIITQVLGFQAIATEKTSAILSIKVGVLAYRGVESAKIRWQPTIEYLNQQIPEYTSHNALDFVITNTGNYVSLAHNYGISRLATLVNKTLDKKTMRFGAVIFTHQDNEHINTLKDLKGKSFIAVNKNGFGGFQMAWAELQKNDVDPFNDFTELRFSGFPQSQVVDAVLNKEISAGTFRTDSLESLVESGKLDISKIKILNKQSDEVFPFLHSTALFPEWPFSKLKYTSEAIAQKVLLALLTVKEDSNAAKSAQIGGWTIPLNYKPANDLMKTLKVGPYENLGKMSFKQIVEEYWNWIIASLILFIIVASLAFSVFCLNTRLKTSNQQLGDEVKKGKRLTIQLRYKATHDSLTKAFNRRAFKELLERELQRCERHNKQFFIFLIDVDEFKIINDTYGHQVGDDVLVNLANEISQVLQKTDVFARIGGDEFAVLCIDTDESNLEVIRNRLKSVSNSKYSIDGKEIKVSFSIGVAVYPHHGRSIRDLYVYADIDMYKNKERSSKKGGA